MKKEPIGLTRAQESRNAIERLYIEMRHLFNRGVYRPSGISGRVVRDSLRTLSPEIYGSLNDLQKVELDGLVYVLDRLPKGIEACAYIKFVTEEGFDDSSFELIIPAKRRRKCYRIDKDQMNIEVTRGRSEIYDALTHLTFLFNEAEKIYSNAFNEQDEPIRSWSKLEEIVREKSVLNDENRDQAFVYLSNILGRTYEETKSAYDRLADNPNDNSGLFEIVYWLGKLAYLDQQKDTIGREISFTPSLRERIGRHIHGEKWASDIKSALSRAGLLDGRPLHIISANLHSVMNSLYAFPALKNALEVDLNIVNLAIELGEDENAHMREAVEKYARTHGMISLPDQSGTNLSVQIFDTSRLNLNRLAPELKIDKKMIKESKPVLIVMDYAFGEQAYETLDELLKPVRQEDSELKMPIASISVMGKAGILEGDKGDIMIPTAHVFEGTADNYPFQNDFCIDDFREAGARVFEGPMITVLGTSLQNKDVLSYFKNSSWRAVGLEMEGAHYQKAIQAESQIRKNISKDILLRYAYYASDNPLKTGSTLASGSLGLAGVGPTYLITVQILNKILGEPVRSKEALHPEPLVLNVEKS